MLPKLIKQDLREDKSCSCGAHYSKAQLIEQGEYKSKGWWANCEDCNSTLYLRDPKTREPREELAA